MIKDKIVYYVMFAIVVSSCGQQTDDGLGGHWHYYKMGYGPFETLDIGHSLTMTDKFELCGGEQIEYPRKNKFGQLILPLDLDTYSETFIIKDDTLTIGPRSSAYKYVKSNIENCLIEDRYSNSSIQISLSVVDSAEKFENVGRLYCSENLYIGKLKTDKTRYDSLSSVFPDSIFLQANGTWINLEDVPRLCSVLKNLCSDVYKPLNINLHADSDVATDFLKEIENLIPDTIRIHRAVRIRNGNDIGLQRLE